MAFAIPSLILKQLYTFGTLKNDDGGVRFSIKNRLSDAHITNLQKVSFDKKEVPLTAVSVDLGAGERMLPSDFSEEDPFNFPLRRSLDIVCDIPPWSEGKHKIEVQFITTPFGKLTLKVDGAFMCGEVEFEAEIDPGERIDRDGVL